MSAVPMRLRTILQIQPPPMLLRAPHPHSLSLLSLSTKPLHFSRLYASSSAAAISSTDLQPDLQFPPPHPWPEWVSFVDRLKSRGYYPSSSTKEGDMVYREFNLLKDPCLSFARDRYDIFPSLSKGEIRNIVEGGCPKIVRKVINSAKRLRAYVGLEEKEVCNVCSLRGSCDRAYLLPDDSLSVRTVDVMRILLFYALDPMVISGAVRPPSIEQAQLSARRLLSILIDLSEASAVPAPAKPSEMSSYKKEKVLRSTDAEMSQDVEIREGDWVCPKCSYLNYARNKQCRKCEDGPAREKVTVEQKAGDWNCPQCACINFARRRDCFRCSSPRPAQTLNPGEWVCSKCDYVNFRRNLTCPKCSSERSEALQQGPQNPGDWVCPKCSYLNFKRNTACRQCGSEHGKEAALQQDHKWRKPTYSTD